MSQKFQQGELVLVSTPHSRFAPAEHKLMRVYTVTRKGEIDTVGSPRQIIGRGVPFAKVPAETVRRVVGEVKLADIPLDTVFSTLEAALDALFTIGGHVQD